MRNYEISTESPITQEKLFEGGEERLARLSKKITGEQLLLQAPEKMDTLLEPIIPRCGIIALAGGSDGGKSCLARDLAINIVSGSDKFLEFPLKPIHRRVIFCSTEDDTNATGFLLRNQCKGLLRERIKNLQFIFEWEDLLSELHFWLTSEPADLVIIDCFADTYGADLKDTSKIRPFLHQYQLLAIKHNCIILFVHHTSKRTEYVEPSKDNLLSGQGFESKMRLVMELRKDSVNPNFRHLCIVKANYLSHEYKQESYVLNFTNNFNFINTEERRPLEFLVRHRENPSKEKYERAKELKDSGMCYEAIAKELGYASKSSVHDLLRKFRANGSVLSH
jgi:RecA-family ATPase